MYTKYTDIHQRTKYTLNKLIQTKEDYFKNLLLQIVQQIVIMK